jgi:hypothetical protein
MIRLKEKTAFVTMDVRVDDDDAREPGRNELHRL